MKRAIIPILMLVITAFAAHWATLAFTPGVIMDRALSTLKNRGIAEHAFTTPQRITPQTQAVVRSSPDLFYSLCRYDLSDPQAQLRVRVAEWPAYQSLSFFDAETNNYATIRATGEGTAVQLFGPAGEGGDMASPTRRGVVLIRRLAPTQEQFDAAKEASAGDACELVNS